MMVIYCPYCRQNTLMTTIEPSQQAEDQHRIFVQQRRQCQRCQRSFHTIEVYADLVHEYDNQLTYQEKLYRSICGRPFDRTEQLNVQNDYLAESRFAARLNI